MWVTIKEEELIEKDKEIKRQIAVNKEMDKIIGEKDKEIKELRNRVAELEDKDWYELCIKQLEEQNNKLIKERDELAFEKQNVFGLIEQMKVKAIGVTKEKILAIRRQLCDKIFKELQENTDCYFEEKECNSPHSPLPYIWFNEIRFRKFLDQIAKGEE